MALFKISKGLKANLPLAKVAGHCWYTIDDSLFYIDYEDEHGVVQRKALNAKDAETLMGASLATILIESEFEIPTSKAVLDALAGKSDVSHTHDDRYYTESEVDTKLETKSDSTHKHDADYDASGSAKLVQDALEDHTGNSDIHVTAANKIDWNNAYTHSQSEHAPVDAEKNQNAFSNVKVGSTTVAADTATDTLEITAGVGISVEGDATNDKVTITNSGVVYVSTGSTDGTIAVYTDGTEADVAVKGFSELSAAVELNIESIDRHDDLIANNSTAISDLQTALSEITEITSDEIVALFNS